MKKLTDALNKIKKIFCEKQDMAEITNTGCVELKNASCRTCGRTGSNAENSGGQLHFNQWTK